MRMLVFVLVLVVMLATVMVEGGPTQLKSAAPASASASAPVCGPINNSCKTSADCCSGCCTNEKCSDCAHSPCAFYHCPEKKTCYLQEVTCVQAPCLPVPACRPDDSDYDGDYSTK